MAVWILDARRTAFALAALIVAGAPAAAESGRPNASSSIQRIDNAAAAKKPTHESCAADYHAHFEGIEGRELAAYREARATIGEVDARLPGRLIFGNPGRSDLDPAARQAIAAGEVLARRQGRTSFARDANTRWIAERIREDLTDYLTQKPTPYLCAGSANYLSTLRTYAAQGAPSPTRLAEDFEAQRRTASFSLEAAFAAMRPAPLPRFAPADRPGLLAIDGLRMALRDGLREPEKPAEPTRLAERNWPTQISHSQIDPDLPPLTEASRNLETEADIGRAITALLRTAERRGFLAEAGPVATDGGHRPVLVRLSGLKAHFATARGAIADPLVRPAIHRALSDLEVLDYLRAAATGTADPLSAALHGTMEAIEAAHATSCTCND